MHPKVSKHWLFTEIQWKYNKAHQFLEYKSLAHISMAPTSTMMLYNISST